MYKTKVYFEDLQDNRHPYNPGDTFPRNGFEVTKERLEELSTNKNIRGIPLITLTDDIIASEDVIEEDVEEDVEKDVKEKAEKNTTEKVETKPSKKHRNK